MWIYAAAVVLVVALTARAWSDPETSDVLILCVVCLVFVLLALALDKMFTRGLRTQERLLADLENHNLFLGDVSRTTGRTLAQLAQHDPEMAAELARQIRAAVKSAEYRDWWSEQGDGATTGAESDRIAELTDRARERQKGDT